MAFFIKIMYVLLYWIHKQLIFLVYFWNDLMFYFSRTTMYRRTYFKKFVFPIIFFSLFVTNTILCTIRMLSIVVYRCVIVITYFPNNGDNGLSAKRAANSNLYHNGSNNVSTSNNLNIIFLFLAYSRTHLL